jgi:iron complex outermembrane receptor protein
MQVSVVDNNVALMQNAAEAHSYGVELEARWKVLEKLDFLAGFGWLEGEFDRYDNHPDGLDLAGNTLPNTNEYTVSLGARYRHELGLFASVTGSLMGPKYMDERNEVEQDSYMIVNAKIGYESSAWAANLYGRNLLDEAYLVHTFDTAGRAGEPLVVGGQVTCYF